MLGIIVYAAFFCSALIMRICFGGLKPNFIGFSGAQNRRCAVLVAGLLSQPEIAFRYIGLPGYSRIACRYSNFGCLANLRSTRRLMARLPDDCLMIGISVGAKIAVRSGAGKQILINPCISSETLRPNLRLLVRLLAPLAEIASYAIGWLAFVPIVSLPAEGEFYSLALLVDQLFAIGYGKTTFDPEAQTNIIISTEDEFLVNDFIVSEFYACGGRAERSSGLVGGSSDWAGGSSDWAERGSGRAGEIVKVETPHASLGDVKHALAYQVAISAILT